MPWRIVGLLGLLAAAVTAAALVITAVSDLDLGWALALAASGAVVVVVLGTQARVGPEPSPHIDPDQVIAEFDRLDALAVDAHPDPVGLLLVVIEALLARHRRLDSLADVDRAVELAERAIALTPPDDDRRLTVQQARVDAYRTRARRTGTLAAQCAAVEVGEQVIAECPEGDPHRLPLLEIVADVYRMRIDAASLPAGECGTEHIAADLARAMELHREAVQRHGPKVL
jgi:hypothetical protein